PAPLPLVPVAVFWVKVPRVTFSGRGDVVTWLAPIAPPLGAWLPVNVQSVSDRLPPVRKTAPPIRLVLGSSRPLLKVTALTVSVGGGCTAAERFSRMKRKNGVPATDERVSVDPLPLIVRVLTMLFVSVWTVGRALPPSAASATSAKV